MDTKKQTDKEQKNERKMAGLRNLDFILGGFLILLQIITYITQSRAGNLSYETGRFIYGIFGAVLLTMGILASPKKRK